MPPPALDEPASISHEEARQEFYGRGPSKTGMAVSEIILIALALVGAAIAFESIENWSQWVVLGVILLTLIGLMIAVSPNRRGASP